MADPEVGGKAGVKPALSSMRGFVPGA